jgi:hypothetical protein
MDKLEGGLIVKLTFEVVRTLVTVDVSVVEAILIIVVVVVVVDVVLGTLLSIIFERGCGVEGGVIAILFASKSLL